MMSKNEYSIAVLLPTRGRTDALSRSVKGLINRAVNPDRLQIIFGLDNDDDEGLAHFESEIQPWLDEKEIAYTAIGFEPLGYARLHDYVNTLAENSSADWMFFWNDDALMETTGWDRVISSYTGQFKLLSVHTHRDHPYSIFPIVPREWLDAVGHLSQHQMNDAWLSQIAYMLDVYQRIEVYVTHDRADLTGNNKDSTYKNRIMLEGNPANPGDFHNIGVMTARIKETETIATWMKSQGMDTTWWENVKLKEQDPWQRLKENDVNKQMVQFHMDSTGRPVAKPKSEPVLVDTKSPETPKVRQLYDHAYFDKADGITSWRSGSLKFGDALAGLSYAHDITWEQLVSAFPLVFAHNEHGRGESVEHKFIHEQLSFLKNNQQRTPKRVLEIGGGRGEVANALKHMGIDVVSVELGADAEKWYQESGRHYFGNDFEAVVPVNLPIEQAVKDLDLSTFDTILMVESLEHIPQENFDPVWNQIVAQFHGRFIVVNWPDYHPIWVGRDASPEEHCRLVDDDLYDAWTKQAQSCVFRKGSHLVLQF